MVLLKLCIDEVRGGQVQNSTVIQLRDAGVDEATEGAIICFPNFMHFGVENSIRMGEGAFEPPCKTQAIGLAIELKAPFLPVGFGKIKVKISQPRVVGHETFTDGDVTERSGDRI